MGYTRAQVLNNIQYNKNLVAQYQREINDWNARINSLWSEIRNLEAKISQLNGRISTYNSQIAELNQLKAKYESLQNAFAQRQAKRQAAFKKNFTQVFSVKFIKSYVSGMGTLLSGNEYRGAYNGLSDACKRIEAEIKDIRRNLNAVTAERDTAQHTINSKRNSISSYQSRINSRNGDLAYRRNRITYWQNMLRYAT